MNAELSKEYEVKLGYILFKLCELAIDKDSPFADLAKTKLMFPQTDVIQKIGDSILRNPPKDRKVAIASHVHLGWKENEIQFTIYCISRSMDVAKKVLTLIQSVGYPVTLKVE